MLAVPWWIFKVTSQRRFALLLASTSPDSHCDDLFTTNTPHLKEEPRAQSFRTSHTSSVKTKIPHHVFNWSTNATASHKEKAHSG